MQRNERGEDSNRWNRWRKPWQDARRTITARSKLRNECRKEERKRRNGRRSSKPRQMTSSQTFPRDKENKKEKERERERERERESLVNRLSMEGEGGTSTCSAAFLQCRWLVTTFGNKRERGRACSRVCRRSFLSLPFLRSHRAKKRRRRETRRSRERELSR